ncbi:MAG: 3-phosphoshikimate 1-carboxyvinyltransferase [Bacteroidota bacterium]|nr:3-phosphoshikimate 1-carboxyvinyltransferase [Bacteroidota bacterium]
MTTVENINAVVRVPTSKSITNRALIAAALANGVSEVVDFSTADDCRLMIEALRKFGVSIEEIGNKLIVTGTGGKIKASDSDIFVGNAGTTMRFLAGLAALADGSTIIYGDERMNLRPIGDLTTALEQLGIRIETNNGYPPVKIVGGELKGGTVHIDASKSSQFVSSILLIAPYAIQDVDLVLGDRARSTMPFGRVASKPYLDITRVVMQSFGADVQEKTNGYYISSTKRYQPATYIIEGDYSSASYFFAAAAVTGGKVTVQNLNPHSKQGDAGFLEVLQKMGCKIIKDVSGITVVGCPELSGITIDMNEMPDMVPTLAVMALFANGKTKIENVAHLRYKESDRLYSLATEIRKLGVEVTEFDDGLEIVPKGKYIGVVIETYNDHRIAMSFAIAGLKIPGIKIINPGCVKKSFPDFWDEFSQHFPPHCKGGG